MLVEIGFTARDSTTPENPWQPGAECRVRKRNYEELSNFILRNRAGASSRKGSWKPRTARAGSRIRSSPPGCGSPSAPRSSSLPPTSSSRPSACCKSFPDPPTPNLSFCIQHYNVQVRIPPPNLVLLQDPLPRAFEDRGGVADGDASVNRRGY